MPDVTITLNAAEALYALEALARKSSDNYRSLTRMVEQGVDKTAFERSVVDTAVRYTDSAHRKLERALFGDDTEACEHFAKSECSNCGWMAELVWSEPELREAYGR